MGSSRIKAIIVNSDIRYTREIQDVLPDYIEAFFSRFSDAKEKLYNGIEDKKIGLVIMNVDEEPEAALSVYKYLKEDPDRIGLKTVPAVLLAADEFAPHCLEYFEIGDPDFYTGSVEDTEFFIAVNDALDEADLLAENGSVDEEDNEAEKSLEKIMGSVYSIDTSNPDAMRVATYDDDSLIEALAASVNVGKEKVKQIYEVLESVALEHTESGDAADFKFGRKKNRTPMAVESVPMSKWKKKESDLSKLHRINDTDKVSELLDDSLEILNEKPQDSFLSKKPMLHYGGNKWGNNTVQTNVQSQQYNNDNKQIFKGVAATPVKASSVARSVLIVDSDPNTLKAFNLFLSADFKSEMVESGMKAIDYVVKNRVDIVALEHDINGMSAVSLMHSIKNQPMGMNAKVFILLQENCPTQVVTEVINTPGVSGVIRKPIVKKQLLATVYGAL